MAEQRCPPESQPLVDLLEEATVELVDGVDVGEEESHEALRHGVLFDHSTAEPLGGTGGRQGHVSDINTTSHTHTHITT